MELTEEDIKRFWSKVDKKEENECWNWTTGLDKKGYGVFKLNGKVEKSHRCSLFLEKGEAPIDKPFALHKCKQNTKCVNPNHLYYGNHQDNKKDQIKDGTYSRGETNGNSKLTEEQVREIREKYIPNKYKQQKLAEEYNVNHSTIYKVINNESWKHIL